jgi:anti-sigma regulatory factor (Ser/Thr protein kinase)
MTTELPLPEAFWPEGGWLEPVRWQVHTLDEAFTVQAAAGELVGPQDSFDEHEPRVAVYASARARVETAMGELVVNGLRHGGPQVRASLARGPGQWLIVVTDAARPPHVGEFPAATTSKPPSAVATGGLGLPMVIGLSTTAGWFTEDHRTHVWALITDVPPSRLLPRR